MNIKIKLFFIKYLLNIYPNNKFFNDLLINNYDYFIALKTQEYLTIDHIHKTFHFFLLNLINSI